MITILEARALLQGLSEVRIRKLCQQGRIRGARKLGRVWYLPERPTVSDAAKGPKGRWRQA